MAQPESPKTPKSNPVEPVKSDYEKKSPDFYSLYDRGPDPYDIARRLGLPMTPANDKTD